MGKKRPNQRVNERSLANLVHIPKGKCMNPNGRAGKDGKGKTRLTLKGMMTTFLDTLSEDQRNLFFMGLYSKAINGDVQAIKLMAQLNDEFNTTTQVEVGDSAKVVVMIPKIETDEDENTEEDG